MVCHTLPTVVLTEKSGVYKSGARPCRSTSAPFVIPFDPVGLIAIFITIGLSCARFITSTNGDRPSPRVSCGKIPLHFESHKATSSPPWVVMKCQLGSSNTIGSSCVDTTVERDSTSFRTQRGNDAFSTIFTCASDRPR